MNRPLVLSEAFLSRAGVPAQASPALEARLDELWEAGRTAWPGVALPALDFVQHLAEHLPRKPAADDPQQWLDRVNAKDLYLACACARGIPEAVAAFDRTVVGRVPAFLAHLRQSPALADEVQQVLREQLLVGRPGAPPGIVGYQGRGALANWVRVSAVRAALKLLADQGELLDQSGRHAIVEALPGGPDPELDYLKNRYRKEFEDAVEAALDMLSSQQRNVLDLRLVGDLGVAEIGALYQVHHATISRWLAAAREGMLPAIQRRLRERLDLTDSQIDSLYRLLCSQLDISLRRILRKTRR